MATGGREQCARAGAAALPFGGGRWNFLEMAAAPAAARLVGTGHRNREPSNPRGTPQPAYSHRRDPPPRRLAAALSPGRGLPAAMAQ